eukprot:CAMPEP_0114555992 /NCGR_PEP_ID=MMETSP0114-20121206/9045_1 /TAXON_ID=31324 /ORGANISM="Goniomonas sp, Strain m" /LENGTH=131 /DNA_ID=CAMNT_0001741155 /DNA_START=146 /DNA_END=538 /DNA_ORIENTATION=-
MAQHQAVHIPGPAYGLLQHPRLPGCEVAAVQCDLPAHVPRPHATRNTVRRVAHVQAERNAPGREGELEGLVRGVVPPRRRDASVTVGCSVACGVRVGRGGGGGVRRAPRVQLDVHARDKDDRLRRQAAAEV